MDKVSVKVTDALQWPHERAAAFNAIREDHKPEARLAAGGKKY